MIIGIDLGTTNSLVAFYKDGQAQIVPNRLEKPLTPSVVAIDDKERVLIGELAREYGYLNPQAMAKTFKRTIGTDQRYQLGERSFDSTELSSLVLRSLKEDAEVYLNESVDEAIISVPAYFNDKQRKATVEAGKLAGLKVSRIISEPTASAIAYGVGDNNKMERCIVFDLGGGTLDISVLEYYHRIMEVHSIAGDNHLGGEDFTALLMEMFLKEEGLSELNLSMNDLGSLYKEAEKAKRHFSEHNESEMTIAINNQMYSHTFTLQEYKGYAGFLLEKIREPLQRAITDARVTLSDIDRIIMVGGATKLPLISEFVQQLTGIVPQYQGNPDTSVVLGAALQCGMKLRDKSIEEVVLTDVCPFTLGTEVVRFNGTFDEDGHYLPIIERNTVIPASHSDTLYTVYNNQKSIRVRILQGESRLANNNLELGNLSIDVPEGPKGSQSITVTYTYDINSLLEVIVKANSTGETKKVIIQNQEKKMTDEEIQQRLELLSYLKQNPREEEENEMLLLRGDRLYQQAMDEERDKIEQSLFEFEKVLSKGDRLEIEHERKKLNDEFDEIEKPVFSGFAS